MSSVGTSLLDEVKAQRRSTGFACGIVAVRGALTDADATDLDELLSDPQVSAEALSRALTARGHRVSGQTVRRHRLAACSCSQ